jgi:hypothetical protein
MPAPVRPISTYRRHVGARIGERLGELVLVLAARSVDEIQT